MFERKNQNILSEHFNKLVDHEGDKPEGDDSDDDFITLKRADHELDAGNLSDQDFISKRKEKMAGSKKAIAKYGSKGTKLIFDDEGKPHQMYEMKSTEDVFKNKDDVKEAGRKFAESERSRLKEADVMDKSEAKEKRKEKKRKRKEREREVNLPLFVSLAVLVNRSTLSFRRKPVGLMTNTELRLLLLSTTTATLAPILNSLRQTRTSRGRLLQNVPRATTARAKNQIQVLRVTKSLLYSCYGANGSAILGTNHFLSGQQLFRRLKMTSFSYSWIIKSIIIC